MNDRDADILFFVLFSAAEKYLTSCTCSKREFVEPFVCSSVFSWFLYHIIQPLTKLVIVTVCVWVCVCRFVYLCSIVFILSVHLAAFKSVSFISCSFIDCPPIALPGSDWTLLPTCLISPLLPAAAEKAAL